MTDTTFDDQGEGDRELLLRFVGDLRADLRSIVFEQPWWDDPEEARLAGFAREAFGDIAGQFDQLKNAIDRRWDFHIESLRGRGLTGRQLRFKLAVNEVGRNRYLERVSDGNSDPRWVGLLAERYLAAADIILESLSDALGGAGGAIGEFKKMIEWLLARPWRILPFG